MRYPPTHPVTIMPIAVVTLADPNTLPTTVGMVEKNPPFDIPFKITKAIMGARVVEAGHRARMLRPVVMSDSRRVFKAPSLSQRAPQPILPSAEEKLKAATRPAPALEGRPMDLAYSGMKKGGTKSGKVPIALARKMTSKVNDLKSRL